MPSQSSAALELFLAKEVVINVFW
nr:unnamed protein product [Digitaria exilis]